MDCTTLQAILSGEVPDQAPGLDAPDLDDDESQAFETHLRACDACRGALAGAEGELEPLVGLMEPPALPAAAWDRVTRAVRQEAARPALVVHAGGQARFPRGLAVAAAFLIAVGIGALLPLDLLQGLSADRITSAAPGPLLGPAPPAPPPVTPDRPAPSVSGGQQVLLGGTHVDVRRLEFDERRFDATALVYDCGDERVVLISVRDL